MQKIRPNKVKKVITGLSALDDNNKFGQLVSALVNEQTANAVLDDEENDTLDNEHEVEDTTPAKDEKDKKKANAAEPEKEDIEPESEIPGGEDETAGNDAAVTEDEWADLEKFKIDGSDEYDLTNASNDEVVKVFKLITDDDKVNVVTTDNGDIKVKDNESEVEYIIDLGNTERPETNKNKAMTEPIFEIAFDECGYNECGYNEGCHEMTDRSVEDILTDGCECHNGVCTCHDDEPQFDINLVNDEDIEEGSSISYANKRRMNMKNVPHTDNPYGQHVTNEMRERYHALIKENKELRALISEMKGALSEGLVSKTNLVNISRLMVENSTTKDEKENILTRFANEATTKEASNKLYEQLSSQLKSNARLNESKIGTEPIATPTTAAKVNETKVYESKELMESLSLMDRIDRLVL